MTAPTTITPQEAAGVADLMQRGVAMITKEETCTLLSISMSALDDLISDGSIQTVKLLKRGVRVPLASIVEHVRKSMYPA
ncbi:MAG: hypothetical protein JWM11_2531 [Planctomycetaceae bacterium]|nr:hypothetical protein [Planctomycetaceae bacterium]